MGSLSGAIFDKFGLGSINIQKRTRAIFPIIIHQIFSLARDWSKGVTWANIPQLKLGNMRGYSPIFKTAHVA